MLPPKCITCGKLLSDIEIEWVLHKEWCMKEHPDNYADLLAKKLDDLHIVSRCCRSQVLTYVELIKVII